MRAVRLALTAVGGGALICGCQSTQDLSAKRQREGRRLLASQHGLVIRAKNRNVQIVRTDLVSDSNGTAAVVVVRNRSRSPLGTVPLAINVLGAAGKSVFNNGEPGLEQSLISVSALPPRGELAWVDDQVTPTGRPRRVRAQAGIGGSPAPRALPRITVSAPRLVTDPVSGLEATGKVTNRSNLTQLRLFVYVTAWRGGNLVAAGRGAIARLLPGRHANYHVFLIGNPKGAQLIVQAPPTILR